MTNLIKKDCLIGIELGTTRVKVGAYSIDGTLLAEKSDNYPLFYDRVEEKAESNPDDWWNAVINTFKKVIYEIKGFNIKGITVGSHGPSVVALNKNYKIVCPSILWMDRRAYKEVDFISKKLYKKSNDLAWYVPRVLWLKNNEPAIFEKIKYLIQPLDFISFKLTGEISASCPTDFIVPWDKDIIDAAGIDRTLFPAYSKMGTIIGYLKSDVASRLNVQKGIPVVAGTGGADFVEVYISEAILKEGIVCDRGGTSQGVNLCWPELMKDSKFFSAPHPLVDGLYHVAGLMSTTGKSLQWYKELYYGKKIPYSKFFKDASRSVPGSKRLIFLPYLMGERTPWWDENARGIFFGLSLDHQEKDIVRSILEGVGYGINHIIRLFKMNGAKPTEIRACGGQARSPLWNQIKADITGLPVKTTQKVDSATLGLAIIAGKGVGVYNNIAEASNEIVKVSKIFEPDKKNHKIYLEMQEIYESLYPKLKDDFLKLSKI